MQSLSRWPAVSLTGAEGPRIQLSLTLPSLTVSTMYRRFRKPLQLRRRDVLGLDRMRSLGLDLA